MKILVSAIACLPGGGSEASVGWAVVRQLAADHEVFVLTSGRLREGWDAAGARGEVPANVHVRFVGNPGPHHPNRLVARLGTWRDYVKFSDALAEEARAWHREVDFEVIHQVTYATWRVPTPLWKIDLPVIWGPIGGAGRVPFSYYGRMGATGAAFELMREASTRKSYRSKALRDALRNCAVVIAANQETRDFLAPLAGGREMPLIPVMAFSRERIGEVLAATGERPTDGPLRLFAGGNMIASKGLAMALRALARARSAGLDFRYLVAGGGPDDVRVRALCSRLGLDDVVRFHPGFGGEDYLRALRQSHIYFLPSLRETTPVTLLEAMLAGCVPVVADISAPGEIVTPDVGRAVACGKPEILERGLAESLLELRQEVDLLSRLSDGASRLVRNEFSESHRREQFRRIYSSLESTSLPTTYTQAQPPTP